MTKPGFIPFSERKAEAPPKPKEADKKPDLSDYGPCLSYEVQRVIDKQKWGARMGIKGCVP